VTFNGVRTKLTGGGGLKLQTFIRKISYSTFVTVYHGYKFNSSSVCAYLPFATYRHACHHSVTWGREGYDGNDGHNVGDFDIGERCGCDDVNTDGLDSFGYGLLIVLWL
jgi:hypothetical protein